ncbi:hypothetical protein [Turicibacter sanguinis]|jgi:hypothetical protein|uniref:hypothetical protein n=1 Tax=Turicibacter sanguinis TaxID=154288 RepID=UPI0021D4A825|nr:hypothetical protein [Turicibacter sanguinis]MCU7202294.1 hypothetical protein [Turicibacter sanguinis]
MNDLTSVLLIMVSILLMVMSYKYHKTVNLLNYTVEKNTNKKRSLDFKVVTKEEFLMDKMKDGMNKETALRCWDEMSKGHNVAFKTDDTHYYSVEYINQYLE